MDELTNLLHLIRTYGGFRSDSGYYDALVMSTGDSDHLQELLDRNRDSAKAQVLLIEQRLRPLVGLVERLAAGPTEEPVLSEYANDYEVEDHGAAQMRYYWAKEARKALKGEEQHVVTH